MGTRSKMHSLWSARSPELVHSILSAGKGHPSYPSLHPTVTEHSLHHVEWRTCIKLQKLQFLRPLQLVLDETLSPSSKTLASPHQLSTPQDSGCKLVEEPARSPPSLHHCWLTFFQLGGVCDVKRIGCNVTKRHFHNFISFSSFKNTHLTHNNNLLQSISNQSPGVTGLAENLGTCSGDKKWQ